MLNLHLNTLYFKILPEKIMERVVFKHIYNFLYENNPYLYVSV